MTDFDAVTAFRLDGTLALITGSRRGIGLGLARGLALAGADVVLNARDASSLEQAASALGAELEVRGCTSKVHARAFDVTAEQAVVSAVAGIEDDIGPLGILVNNAGIQVRGHLTEIAATDWERVLATDLTSAFIVGREVARRMLPRGRGKIVNVCSVQSQLVRATTAPYAAAKGGLANLTQAMCAEWAASGIQANGLAPGYIETDLNASLVADPEFNAWITRRTPAGRWGSVEDLVGPAVWLCSPASNFVNGQVIYADGGITAVI
jgi:gluconate 5-dehydrogenase